MNITLVILTISGSLLLFFAVLFHIESTRGKRLLMPGARSWLDVQVRKIHFFLTHLTIHFGSGSIRIAFHFVAHKFLGILLWLLHTLESFFAQIQKRNRAVARIVRKEQEKTHLDLLAEHQESNVLTDEDKQKLKDKSIEGG